MSTNPFASPSEQASYTPPPAYGEDSFVKQIPFVGVFMIVEGVLEFLYGVMMLGFAFFFLPLMANDREFQEAMQRSGPGAEYMTWFYVVLGAGPFVASLFRVIGGVLALQRRARGFVIAANAIGFLSALGCYCIPTGFATSIYSLVVLLQTPVAQAFARAAAEREQARYQG